MNATKVPDFILLPIESDKMNPREEIYWNIWARRCDDDDDGEVENATDEDFLFNENKPTSRLAVNHQ